MRSQLELARRRGLIDEAKHAELKSQLEEISKMLSGLISGLENRNLISADGRNRVREER